MQNYLVRVKANPNFIEPKWYNGEMPIQKLINLIPNIKESITTYCTFASFIIESENIHSIKSKIFEIWNQIYPNKEDIISVIAVQYNNSDLSYTMKCIYSYYYGWQTYQELCTEICSIVPFIKYRKAEKKFLNFNYLVSIDNGYGFSQMVSSFGDLLTKLNVFEGKSSNIYEYKIGAESKDGNTSIDDFIDAIFDEEKYYSVIGVDVSYFLSKDNYEALRNFLNRLYKQNSKLVFMFRIPFLEKKALDDIRNIITDIINIKDIIIPPIHNLELYEYLFYEITSFGYSIDNTMMELFYKKLAQEKRDGRFYGFKTVEKIVDEIIWRNSNNLASLAEFNQDTNDNIIRPEEISGFIKDNNSNDLTGFQELEQLIGMENIMIRVKEIVSQVKVAIKDKSVDRPSIHMRFLGAPGTGKTTVARILGKIFKEEGILRKGALIECTGRGLCGQFVGQTAPRTSAFCRDAYGSVLFIDEAYALYDKNHESNDYGKEAITTLVTEMENHRDDFVVIMAGYTDEMENMMAGNIGLRSRMPFSIEFKNYTKEQLFNIFMDLVKRHFKFADNLENVAKEYFMNMSDEYINSKEFANARFVRNLYERVWSKSALRNTFEGISEIVISAEDFNSATAEKEFVQKSKTSKKMGFFE
ncbi:MAG: AAA family ATPase [Bacteroidales bacterium]|nr:AAA family ATPase [Bacteroidales bacterium]